MGLAARILETIKRNNRRVSDEFAGHMRYFSQWTTNLALYRVVAAIAPDHLRGRVLDAGAGRRAWHFFLRRCTATIETLDVDRSAGEVDHVGDLQRMPLADASYDAVFCTQVLHHLPDPQAAVREIARVLRPGGGAVISVPHLAWLHNEPNDYWRFTEHGLRHLLGEAGLREVAIVPAGGLIAFLGIIPTMLAFGLLRSLGPLWRPALPVNWLFVRLCLALDAALGCRGLYPANYVAVAQKP